MGVVPIVLGQEEGQGLEETGELAHLLPNLCWFHWSQRHSFYVH